jgi:hypothetical protein
MFILFSSVLLIPSVLYLTYDHGGYDAANRRTRDQA